MNRITYEFNVAKSKTFLSSIELKEKIDELSKAYADKALEIEQLTQQLADAKSAAASLIVSLNAQIRRGTNNRGATISAVTLAGMPSTTTTVVDNDPLVTVSVTAVSDAVCTADGTVTTIPGRNSLTKRAAQSTQIKADLIAAQCSLVAANAKITELTNTVGEKNNRIIELEAEVQRLFGYFSG